MKRVITTVLTAACFAATCAMAQQDVPFRGGIPVAPMGLADKPLGSGPFEFKTGEDMDIRVVVITNEIEFPWSLMFLPNGDMLVTTRAGEIRHIRNGVLERNPVAGGPASFSAGTSGLPGAVHGYMDLALHPSFARNNLVYLTYTKPMPDDRTTLALGRGAWNGRALQRFEDIYVAEIGTAGPSRIVFGNDGKLYMTASGGDAQDGMTLGGKVLRINDDGSIPDDNPFVGRAGFKPEVYTLGHRNSLGLAKHPTTISGFSSATPAGRPDNWTPRSNREGGFWRLRTSP